MRKSNVHYSQDQVSKPNLPENGGSWLNVDKSHITKEDKSAAAPKFTTLNPDTGGPFYFGKKG